jgi:hypothetical protein
MADAVADFWTGIDSHDWDLVASTLADDFVRIGMADDEADTTRGKDTYMSFVSQVVGKMDHHDLRTDRIIRSADGRTAYIETVETIQPPGQDKKIVMRFLNLMELNEQGLITKLDIFWKTPPQMPPEWIAVDAVLERDEP